MILINCTSNVIVYFQCHHSHYCRQTVQSDLYDICHHHWHHCDDNYGTKFQGWSISPSPWSSSSLALTPLQTTEQNCTSHFFHCGPILLRHHSGLYLLHRGIVPCTTAGVVNFTSSLTGMRALLRSNAALNSTACNPGLHSSASR